jgi:GNAT superfamily N-acetyltransferase
MRMTDTGDYEISTDEQRLQIDVVHGYLARSYWAAGIPRSIVERAIAGSLCFGVYYRTDQVGFARVITDRTTFAYLSDVFILEPHRGKGLSRRLMEQIAAHPDLQGLRRFMLATNDAHGLYQQFGFSKLANPERLMEIVSPNPYQR